MTPARSHTVSSSPGEPTSDIMTPDLRKMPDPMTPPTTSMTVLKSPSVGTSPENRILLGEPVARPPSVPAGICVGLIGLKCKVWALPRGPGWSVDFGIFEPCNHFPKAARSS